MGTSDDASEKLTGAGDAATWGVGAVPVIAMVARTPSVRPPARIAGRRRARRSACRRLRRAAIVYVLQPITPEPSWGSHTLDCDEPQRSSASKPQHSHHTPVPRLDLRHSHPRHKDGHNSRA